MSDTFDSDPSLLPPVTKALREVWLNQPDNPFGNPPNFDAIPTTWSMRAVLDAVHTLETRIATLEAG
ncbi:hypothetical protein [Mycobacterium shigaense]|uniref:hypothetical protein n=1 Tax=Mycobacterium shigaense TaxID=722731 RepID=UPI002ADFA10A|nr:hypothetical protein [Mycobacterium shigaense]MEA1123892.1 hypothetical protein [Mycobacterium shigaense]